MHGNATAGSLNRSCFMPHGLFSACAARSSPRFVWASFDAAVSARVCFHFGDCTADASPHNPPPCTAVALRVTLVPKPGMCTAACGPYARCIFMHRRCIQATHCAADALRACLMLSAYAFEPSWSGPPCVMVASPRPIIAPQML